ncbi:uncharacterized protein [Physcomitrium patens]|uniref:uncharacterized protein n=1 Tax=Physcomitrium patens TaxID=3218 RepID=UPI003CCCE28D
MRSKFQSGQVEGRGVYTFCVNRELCHYIGNLQPDLDEGARFAQIYFLDDGLQTNRRMEIFDDLHRDVINNIQEVLESINALVRGFKSSRDVLQRGQNMGLRISECYQGVVDALQEDNGARIGCRIILDELELGQSPPDRLDIIVRVFKLKLRALMDEITKKNVMGETITFCYTIEFQKRGLPHAHILLWLKDKVNDCDLVDRIVCAEIPDLDRQPQFFVKTVKYLHKYIFKGPDRGVVETDEVVDEIKDFLEGRYVAAQEACWRLFGFETNNKSHSICRLPVHLPGQQYVTFKEGTSLHLVIDQNAETKLTKFFELNCHIRALIASGNQGNHMLLRYMDLPLYYKWDVKNNMWERRVRKIKFFGRINMVPIGIEVFYLRLLLTHVEAPTSFEDLLCFHDIVHPTYKAACIARGLLQDDSEWENCLQEATVIALPKQVWRLFATLLVFGQLLDPLSLLKTHLDAMSDDWRNNQNRYYKAILSIEEYLSSSNKHLTDFFNIEELNEFGYSNIVDVGDRLFFLDGPGGTDIGEGKTGPKVDLPLGLVAPGNSLDGLIDVIFDDVVDFSERVILAIRNDDAQEINRKITDRIPGDVHQCFSADFVHENDEHGHHYPVEFLNSLQLSSLPPHQLSLKCGQYLMLPRNLNPAKDLCNSSRLRLLQVSSNVLLCEIVEGRYRSQEVLIPIITHHCNDSRLPFTLCRRQFPITGAFAMTINKSQGQSYDRVGIYLRNEVFSHGQLYVALSRGRHPANIKVTNDNNEAVGTVKNIVYHEVFT